MRRSVNSQAVQLAEPEGYIRSSVDEGTTVEALLYRLRKQHRKHGATPYLDTVLAAFQKEKTAHVGVGNQTRPELLSKRELQVLQLLAYGSSNLEIAQKLVITVNTVKRHVSHTFSKFGAQNRLQAVKLARDLDILSK